MLVDIKSIDCETEEKYVASAIKEIAYLRGVWIIGMLDPETSYSLTWLDYYLVCNLALACLYVLTFEICHLQFVRKN